MTVGELIGLLIRYPDGAVIRAFDQDSTDIFRILEVSQYCPGAVVHIRVELAD